MSIPSAFAERPWRIRRYLRSAGVVPGRADGPYSPVFCLAFLLIVGFAVKVVH
jgi:hypothetical protein